MTHPLTRKVSMVKSNVSRNGTAARALSAQPNISHLYFMLLPRPAVSWERVNYVKQHATELANCYVCRSAK